MNRIINIKGNSDLYYLRYLAMRTPNILQNRGWIPYDLHFLQLKVLFLESCYGSFVLKICLLSGYRCVSEILKKNFHGILYHLYWYQIFYYHCVVRE